MQEKVKEIVAVFLKTPKEQLSGGTVIDRSAVSSSILLHRMYAKLAAEGVPVSNYQDIRTIEDLLQRINGHTMAEKKDSGNTPMYDTTEPSLLNAGVGIDIEEIASMPITNDFREDAFYQLNFSASEMAYCILRPDPYASFAGLFAAKEAMVKADKRLKSIEFNKIIIQHHAGGEPAHDGFQLSISHTGTTAVAIALPLVNNTAREPFRAAIPPAASGVSVIVWVLLAVSVILSLVSLFLFIRR